MGWSIGGYLEKFNPLYYTEKGLDWIGLGEEYNDALDYVPWNYKETGEKIDEKVNEAGESIKEAAGGLTDGLSNKEAIKKAVENEQLNQGLWDESYNAITGPSGYLQQYLDTATQRYNPNEYNTMYDAYKNTNPYQGGTFSYNGNLNDFTSPASALRVKTAMDQITKSKANAGDMFSSDYLAKLNAQAQGIASEEYEKAFERMMKDRSTNLQEWQANQNEAYKSFQSQMDKTKGLLDINATDRNNFNDAYDNYISNMINAEMAKTQGKTNVNTNIANLYAQQDNPWMNLVKAGTDVASTVAKFKSPTKS